MRAAAAVLRPLPFDPPVLLAPMEGLTLRPVRAAIERHGGLGAVFTEFLGEGPGSSPRVARRVVDRGSAPLVVQLLGRDPERLATATGHLVDAGAEGVDLNVGCPSRRAASARRGAALLRDLPHLSRVLGAMVRAGGPVPVSAKIRVGWHDPDRLLEIVKVVEESGCAFLTIHGRTCAEGFTGEVRMDLIATVARQVEIPIVANGDIVRASQAHRILEEGLADGVMIGRGAVRNPWIFAQLAALRSGSGPPPSPRPPDLLAEIDSFESHLLEAFGTRRRPAVLAKMKEIVSLLAGALVEPAAFRHEARRAQSLEEFHDVVARRIATLPDDGLLLDP